MAILIQVRYIQQSWSFLIEFNTIDGEKSEVYVMVLNIEIWSVAIALAVVSVNGIIKRKKQVKFLNLIITLEKELNDHKFISDQKQFYLKYKKISMGLCMSVLIYFLILGMHF